MPTDLTPSRLRELIAAATQSPVKMHPITTPYTFLDWCGTAGRLNVADADLFVALVNNASALADALEKAELLDWVGADWMPLAKVMRMRGERCTLAEALRAAKDAADAK